MKLGSLFSGGGLGDFGFMAAGMEIAWQCEIDEYCQKILALRYPESKKYRDIKTLKGEELEKVDIITGGFPCQPFSVAGKQMGIADDRNLWPEMRRVISETNPSWVVCENVPGIIPIYLDTIYSDLETLGYEVMPFIVPAHALGASHRRNRLWIVSHAKHLGYASPEVTRIIEERIGNYQKREEQAWQSSGPGEQYEAMVGNPNGRNGNKRTKRKISQRQDTKSSGVHTIISNTESAELSWEWGTAWNWRSKFRCGGWWSTEPAVGRVANGIADRVHRLKMLGNGQVPACTYVIGKMIMDIEGK